MRERERRAIYSGNSKPRAPQLQGAGDLLSLTGHRQPRAERSLVDVRSQGGLWCLFHELPPRRAAAGEIPDRYRFARHEDQRAFFRQDALHLFGSPGLYQGRGDMRDRFRTLDLCVEKYGNITTNALQGTQVGFRGTRENSRHIRPLQRGPGEIRAYYQGLQG